MVWSAKVGCGPEGLQAVETRTPVAPVVVVVVLRNCTKTLNKRMSVEESVLTICVMVVPIKPITLCSVVSKYLLMLPCRFSRPRDSLLTCCVAPAFQERFQDVKNEAETR